MSNVTQVVLASRKRDKFLLIFGTFLMLVGLVTILYVQNLGIVIVLVGFGIRQLGKFLDWWNRGLIGDRRFHDDS